MNKSTLETKLQEGREVFNKETFDIDISNLAYDLYRNRLGLHPTDDIIYCVQLFSNQYDMSSVEYMGLIYDRMIDRYLDKHIYLGTHRKKKD